MVPFSWSLADRLMEVFTRARELAFPQVEYWDSFPSGFSLLLAYHPNNRVAAYALYYERPRVVLLVESNAPGAGSAVLSALKEHFRVRGLVGHHVLSPHSLAFVQKHGFTPIRMPVPTGCEEYLTVRWPATLGVDEVAQRLRAADLQWWNERDADERAHEPWWRWEGDQVVVQGATHG
jgi:hypothetical protein